MEYQLQNENKEGRNQGIKREKEALSFETLLPSSAQFISLDDCKIQVTRLKEMLRLPPAIYAASSGEELLQFIENLTSITQQILKVYENLSVIIVGKSEKNAPTCTEDVGAFFLPALLNALNKRPPIGEESLLQAITHQYLETKDPDRIKELQPSESLRTVQFLFATKIGTQLLPNAEHYVRLSKEKEMIVAKFDKDSKEIHENLEKTREMNNKSRSKTGNPMYGERERILEEQLDQNKKKVPALFPDISDVSPLQVSRALTQITADVAISVQLMNELLTAQSSLERLIATVVTSPKNIESFSLVVPCLKENKITSHMIEVDKGLIAEVTAKPEVLAQLVERLVSLRVMTRSLIYGALKHSAYSSDAKGKIISYLQEPFKRMTNKHHEITAKLLEHPSPLVQTEALSLISQPIPLDPDARRWGYVLDNPENSRLIKAACKEGLTTANKDVADALLQFLSLSPITAKELLPYSKSIRKILEKKQLYGLGICFDDILQDVEKHGTLLQKMFVISALQVFSEKSELRPYLRQQIPNIAIVKTIVSDLIKSLEEQEHKIRDLGRTVTCSLSHSLEDYYLDEGGEELKEFIDDYRFYLDNMHVLGGVAGNVGIRSAMLIYGPPGVGKTHFVECLENELGIPLNVLSASEKDKGDDKIDYLRKVIEQVKRGKKPCILLIDEAESTVLDRTSPMASSDDRHVTNYLLQEINELRKSHPYVLTILATNYIERIDDAIIRPGRVDILFEMKPMSPAGRRDLIIKNLIQEKIELELGEGDWSELMQVTDGFIPICISQTVVGTNRIYLNRRRLLDPEISFTKELLMKKFNEEALRYKRFIQIVEQRHKALGRGIQMH